MLQTLVLPGGAQEAFREFSEGEKNLRSELEMGNSQCSKILEYLLRKQVKVFTVFTR